MSTQYTDIAQPNLVDRWKSFSLSPFIGRAVNSMNFSGTPIDFRRGSYSVRIFLLNIYILANDDT